MEFRFTLCGVGAIAANGRRCDAEYSVHMASDDVLYNLQYLQLHSRIQLQQQWRRRQRNRQILYDKI